MLGWFKNIFILPDWNKLESRGPGSCWCPFARVTGPIRRDKGRDWITWKLTGMWDLFWPATPKHPNWGWMFWFHLLFDFAWCPVLYFQTRRGWMIVSLHLGGSQNSVAGRKYVNTDNRWNFQRGVVQNRPTNLRRLAGLLTHYIYILIARWAWKTTRLKRLVLTMCFVFFSPAVFHDVSFQILHVFSASNMWPWPEKNLRPEAPPAAAPPVAPLAPVRQDMSAVANIIARWIFQRVFCTPGNVNWCMKMENRSEYDIIYTVPKNIYSILCIDTFDSWFWGSVWLAKGPEAQNKYMKSWNDKVHANSLGVRTFFKSKRNPKFHWDRILEKPAHD